MIFGIFTYIQRLFYIMYFLGSCSCEMLYKLVETFDWMHDCISGMLWINLIPYWHFLEIPCTSARYAELCRSFLWCFGAISYDVDWQVLWGQVIVEMWVKWGIPGSYPSCQLSTFLPVMIRCQLDDLYISSFHNSTQSLRMCGIVEWWNVNVVSPLFFCFDSVALIHCCLEAPHDKRDLGQHWLM